MCRCRLTLHFKKKHVQSLEGDDLAAYTKLTIAALALSCTIFVEKIYTIRHLNWRDSSVRRCFIVDMLIQVCPIYVLMSPMYLI